MHINSVPVNRRRRAMLLLGAAPVVALALLAGSTAGAQTTTTTTSTTTTTTVPVCGQPSTEGLDVAVVFCDPALRRVVGGALGVAGGAEITRRDMQRLTDLNAAKQGISDLEGLQYATKLQYLYLTGNRIGNDGLISFASMRRLLVLTLGENRFSVLDVGGATSLGALILERSPSLVSISNLDDLTGLWKLDVRGSFNLTGLPGLDSVVNMTSLLISRTRMTTITLPRNVSALHAQNIGKTTFTVPDTWTRVRLIDLRDNNLTSLTLPAASIATRLQSLTLGNNHLTSLPFKDYPTLLTIDVSKNRMETVDVTGLSKLRSLDVRDMRNSAGTTRVSVTVTGLRSGATLRSGNTGGV